MNRRDFIQALAAASAAAAVPITAAHAHSHLVDGVVTSCDAIRETVWRDGNTVTYSYDADFTVRLSDAPCRIQRIWADGVCVYGEDAELRVDLETRSAPDTRVTFRQLPIEAFGNRVPHIKAEIVP